MVAAKQSAADTVRRPADAETSDVSALLERLTVTAGPPYDADAIPDDLVVVRLLGPVVIQTPTGIPVPPGRITEAIAYLACHRGDAGVAADRLIDVLWDGRAVNRQRLTEVISRARQAIGGVERIPRRSNGHGYRVADSVVTDIELVGWWVRHAQRDPDGIREHLGAALNLVTGRPFADVDWTWALLEGHASAAVALICDVATALGQWCLDHDDPAGALHAAGQARKASPDSEQLARLRMRAHHQRGDIDRVRSVMTELRAAVDADLGPDGDDQLHPDTITLYRKLTSTAATAVG
jgi:two-component SAPR family response regulator